MTFREERRINFSTAELIQALCFFCETTNLDLPFSNNMKVEFRTEDELIATLNDPDRDDVTREFLESEIAVALILLCRKMNIPIARRARKSIELAKEGVIFIMKITDENVQL